MSFRDIKSHKEGKKLNRNGKEERRERFNFLLWFQCWLCCFKNPLSSLMSLLHLLISWLFPFCLFEFCWLFTTRWSHLESKRHLSLVFLSLYTHGWRKDILYCLLKVLKDCLNCSLWHICCISHNLNLCVLMCLFSVLTSLPFFLFLLCLTLTILIHYVLTHPSVTNGIGNGRSRKEKQCIHCMLSRIEWGRPAHQKQKGTNSSWPLSWP